MLQGVFAMVEQVAQVLFRFAEDAESAVRMGHCWHDWQ